MVPVASMLALVLAWYFYRQMMRESEGTPSMEKIASHVRRGAMWYLRATTVYARSSSISNAARTYQPTQNLSESGKTGPATVIISAPILTGLLFGVPGVIGLLIGGLSSGFVLAIFMANAAGGAMG